MGIKRSKAEILESIGVNMTSAKNLILRIEELREITSAKSHPADCRFTLSTIHSAKGLEYDTVYLADVCDGIFPETVITNHNADKDAVRTYEEERRLFYVGATRAKNRLFVFSYAGKTSFFCDDFLKKSENVGQTFFSGGNRKKDYSFADFCKDTCVGAHICHKAFGNGQIVKEDGDIIEAVFDGKGTRKLSRKLIYEMNLLK
jgi:DNA helicase-2/ATP-dependent DNA helicase PcrA